jgi:PAS domain S-box-containing protein
MAARLGAEQIAGLGFEQIVRTAPVAISVIDTAGRVIHSNRTARDLTRRQLGVEMPVDLDGAIDIFHPDGRRYEREEWPAVRSIVTGEEIVDEEFFYALPDGGRLPIRCSCSPVRPEDDGQIVAVVLAMTDVTEQKRQEDLLTYFAELLENSEDAVVAMDDRYLLCVWSKGAERLYGWEAKEVIGHHAGEVARTNLTDAQRTELRRDLAASGRWRGDVTVARKDGGTVEAELVSVALRGQQGEITGYLTIHRDISERKRAEKTLRAAERQSATILESITDAFVAVDGDWRYTYVNDRALARMRERKSIAFEREEIIGRSMWEMFPEALGTELERRYRQVMRDRRPAAFEVYLEFSGEWIEAHAYPTEAGIAIYYRDVTARRRAEEALRDVRAAERSRIARDLHDGALQGLARAAAAVSGRDDRVAAILGEVGLQLRDAVYGLRMEHDDEPFEESLRELVALNREIAPACQVTLEIEAELPSLRPGSRGAEVLRIVGEALRNACRHAGATDVVVRLTGSGTRLTVAVSDDGGGFDAAPARRGQGLRGMAERAELLGAELDVQSGPAGTTVRLDVLL